MKGGLTILTYLRVRLFKATIFALLFTSVLSEETLAQRVRSGAAYLKILPGTRQQNMAGSLTGSLDGIYTIYANPGATGLLRHWQFSASYSKWIAGIQNTSLFYGQQFRLNTFLSDEITIGLGFNYQHLGDFDATGGNNFVSAQDILLNLSVGYPLNKISRNLSIGTNIKYFKSELAQYKASTAVLDAGFIYRTRRVPLDFLFADHFIFSFGAAVTQLGKPLTFISLETPLPRTFRLGVALNLGKHDAQQLQVAIDYRKVRHEDGRVGFGLEIINPFGRSKWVPQLVFRGGHVFDEKRDERLINKFSVGLSFRLDDYMKSYPRAKRGDHFFLKNAALRVDGGFLNSDTFKDIYQGSITYRPIGPEPFRFINSDLKLSYQVCDTVKLAWQAAKDPDLFDDVNYLLLITKNDSTALNRYIEMAKRNELNSYLRVYETSPEAADSAEIRLLHVPPKSHSLTNRSKGSNILDVVRGSKFFVSINKRLITHELYIPMDAPGDYFWTVMAYDRNRHFRVINGEQGHIARFHAKSAPLLTIKIEKQQNQKVAAVIIKNMGDHAVDRNFLVRVSTFDSTDSKSFVLKSPKEPEGELAAAGFYLNKKSTPPQVIDWEFSPAGKVIARRVVTHLEAGDSLHFQVKLDEDLPYVIAEVDSGNMICANRRDTLSLADPHLRKNVVVEAFIPKVLFHSVGSYNLTNSARLELRRLSKAFQSPLLKDVCIKLDGHTDEQGWPGRSRTENDSLNKDLSFKRVNSVRNYLDSLGVDTSRIIIEGYGWRSPRIPKVDSTYSHLTKVERDSLHRINRRVEVHLIKQCKSGTCNIDSLSNCSGDTLKIVNSGDALRYVFDVTNQGLFAAKDILIKDIIPKYIVPMNDSVLTNGRNHFSRAIDALSPGSTIRDTLIATVEAALPDTLLRLVNSAHLSSPNDLNVNNNTAQDTIYIIGGRPPNTEPTATNVRIIGINQVGEVLTGKYQYYDADHDPEGNTTFRWFRNRSAIFGATAKTYRLKKVDLSKRIHFEVTPVARRGISPGLVAKSASVGPVRLPPNRAPVVDFVEIIGRPQVGETLTGSYVSSDPDGDPLGEATVRWLRDRIVISEARSESYKLKPDDIGAIISFEVTPLALQGVRKGKAVASHEIGPVIPKIQKIEINGLPQVGMELSVEFKYNEATNLDFKYEWQWSPNEQQRFSKIKGETGKTYKLRPEDKGKFIRCVVIPVVNGIEVNQAAQRAELGPISPPGVDIW